MTLLFAPSAVAVSELVSLRVQPALRVEVEQKGDSEVIPPVLRVSFPGTALLKLCMADSTVVCCKSEDSDLCIGHEYA